MDIARDARFGYCVTAGLRTAEGLLTAHTPRDAPSTLDGALGAAPAPAQPPRPSSLGRGCREAARPGGAEVRRRTNHGRGLRKFCPR